MREAARLRNARPEGDLAAIEPLLSHANPRIAADAARLIGTWNTPHALTLLRELAGDGSRRASPELQVAAVEGLREFGGPEVIGILHGLVAARPVQGVPRAAAIALAALDLPGSLPAILGVVQELPQDSEKTDAWRAVLANKGAADQLAKAVQDGTAGMDKAARRRRSAGRARNRAAGQSAGRRTGESSRDRRRPRRAGAGLRCHDGAGETQAAIRPAARKFSAARSSPASPATPSEAPAARSARS